MRKPKILVALVFSVAVFIVALAGGALGNAFNGGFLGAPLPAIALPAESVTSGDVIGGFHVTNTMVATWLAIIVLLLITLVVRLKLAEVPGRIQGIVELIMEFFLGLTESIAGHELARRFFPLVMTIFIFIVTANWMGILPGFGTIGRIESVDEVIHHHEKAKGGEVDKSHIKVDIFDGDGGLGILSFGSIDDSRSVEDIEKHGPGDGKQAGILVPFLRSANTDVNMPLAIAVVAMFMVHSWALRALGVFGHLGKFINLKEGPIGFFVGLLEAISEVAKIISFTFRLFGNMFAGEVLLIAMAFLLPLIGIIPFLGLELFVGVIQAFIFAMLVLVFAAAATVSHHGEQH
ncbi:F0F1 ATP synthase subunit A [Dehalococcoidia bacterium]|nr:F0F1 ATP synthase subunit A [Dehalococcoidia bacterium]